MATTETTDDGIAAVLEYHDADDVEELPAPVRNVLESPGTRIDPDALEQTPLGGMLL